MIKTKQVLKLSNLINDCVVMVQQAGALVQKTNIKAGVGPLAAARRAKTSVMGQHDPTDERENDIAKVDQMIRQTFMHNLSQLFPGIQIICQGEKPTKELHFAHNAYI